MSNSNRNPKDIKDLIQTCKSNQEEMNYLEQSIKNLKNLPDDEKTELGLCKARIDEQSRLIMVLKQRCDEYIKKNMTLDALYAELLHKSDKQTVESKCIIEKYQVLESRFKVLNDNHEELIKIKDEYKHECDILRQLNKKYLAQLSENTREKELLDEQNVLNGKLQTLNEQIREYEQRIALLIEQYETKIKTSQTESEQTKSKYEQEIKDLSRKFEQFSKHSELMVKELSDKLSKSDQLLNQHKLSIASLEKERDEQRLMNKKLVEDNHEASSKLRQMEEKYSQLSREHRESRQNPNSSLSKQLDDLNKRYKELKSEFNSYQVYAKNLIEKEKEINSKLRAIMS